MNRLRLGMLSLAGFVWLGCSAAGTTNNGGTGGTTGSGGATGTGGTAIGTGGTVVGTGGTVVGTGGAVVGTGGTIVGTGGTIVGTGGTVVGTGGTSGGAIECTGAAIMNGYLDNGTMCGYAWTGMNKNGSAAIPGQSIDPPCGTGAGAVCFTGTTICASAEIPANDPPAYAGVMIGWNVAQDETTETTWNATGTGITVTYTDGGATGVVRVLVQSGGTDYCAVATASPATFSWSDFQVKCYDAEPGASFAAGSPVKAIVLQVNGDDAAPQSLTNFCLNNVTLN